VVEVEDDVVGETLVVVPLSPPLEQAATMSNRAPKRRIMTMRSPTARRDILGRCSGH
jgi:hypothetical protein